MKNGDMPANVLVSSTGVLWSLRDGHEDSNYIGQPNERFSFGLTKREMFAMAAMQGILACDNSEFTHVAAISAVAQADHLLAALEAAK
jgi:hypothetical protein